MWLVTAYLVIQTSNLASAIQFQIWVVVCCDGCKQIGHVRKVTCMHEDNWGKAWGITHCRMCLFYLLFPPYFSSRLLWKEKKILLQKYVLVYGLNLQALTKFVVIYLNVTGKKHKIISRVHSFKTLQLA